MNSLVMIPPFSCTALDARPQGDDVVALSVEAGVTATVIVRLFNFEGGICEASDGSGVEAVVHGGAFPINAMVEGVAGTGGAVEVTFSIRTAGEYEVAVLFGGRHIRGSPYSLTVRAGSIEARACTLSGPGCDLLPLTVDEETHVQVQVGGW